ncbi:MAG: hypothetical protein QM765_30315 [Myxococcales bacterium]
MPIELFRKTFQAESLMREHPPRLRHPNKQLVFDLACPAGARHQGEIAFSRWRADGLPGALPAERPKLTDRPGFFDYPRPQAGTVEWHINFADPRLFAAYAGPLLAQDELQVAEHPALGAVREALEPLGEAFTEDARGPTPVLVTGVERRCALSGLYGNAFARAAPKAVKAAVRTLSPPPRSNVLAIAAPVGRGPYTLAQIERITLTATTGLLAAKGETERLAPGARTVVHTGFWGCGAFGGDRVLMTALQVVAARLAGVEALLPPRRLERRVAVRAGSSHRRTTGLDGHGQGPRRGAWAGLRVGRQQRDLRQLGLTGLFAARGCPSVEPDPGR